VPTLTFQLLYCFFVIEHGRRRILHFNVTRHPSAEWVVQQLREAFPEIGPYRYVILDCDSKFDATVITFLKATGLKPKRTSIQSPVSGTDFAVDFFGDSVCRRRGNVSMTDSDFRCRCQFGYAQGWASCKALCRIIDRYSGRTDASNDDLGLSSTSARPPRDGL
jgi:hypothetical protein